MKILLAFATLLLIGCATPQVGPKANTTPVSTSNANTRAGITRTRASISRTRASIKTSQEHAAKGASALEKADSLITQMLKK
jgi:hypothetical protein